MTMAAVVTVIGVWVGEGDHRGGRLVVGTALAVGIAIVLRVAFRPEPDDHSLRNSRNRRWLERQITRRGVKWSLIMLLMVTGSARSSHEWNMVEAVRLGPHEGDVVIRSDPRRIGRGTQAVVEIDGQRFEVWGYGAMGTRLDGRAAGEAVWMSGERQPLSPGSARRRQIRHVVGRFDALKMGSARGGALARASPVQLAAHRIRLMLEEGTRVLDPSSAALFAGLVYGDDSDQDQETIEHFRRSGLAHLTAVSGQNVAYVLALIAPILTRLKRPLRWGATLMVLGWFVVLTRFEPSVVRAGLMAAVAATVFALGKQASSRTVLGLAVIAGLLIDPFLAWSVGWWLSVGGTAGLIAISPILSHLAPRGDGWVGQWVTPMLGAQIGVLPVSYAVFGAPNALSIPCNLLAVPVAGLVMLIGLPAALVAGILPLPVAEVVMWPLEVGVRWVDTVAALGARLRPPPFVDQFVAGVLIAAVLVAARRSRRSVTT